MNINLKKGTVVSFTVPPQAQMIGRDRTWNSVTVEFFPETGAVKQISLRGPGPSVWEGLPCQEQSSAPAIEPRQPSIRK